MKYISTYKQEQAETDLEYRSLLLDTFSTFYLIDPGVTWAKEEKLMKYEKGLDFLLSQNKEVIGHCLIEGKGGFNGVPQLKNFKTIMKNYEEKQEMVKEYLFYMLNRFGDRIKTWYLFNEVTKTPCIAENAFGPDFMGEIYDFCKQILPDGEFRNNEYGFQNKNIIYKMATKSMSAPGMGIGIQVYTSGKNPLLGHTLTSRIKSIRERLPNRDLYFSEVSVISNNPILIKQAYKTILKVATENDIKEIGFWWPVDLYNKTCWEKGITSGLWNQDLERSDYYPLFLPQ